MGIRTGRAGATRKRLIDEATRAFAEQGIHAASLIEITRRAGQRNRAALYYHFGSREGVLCAVLEEHVAFLARREGELLEIAKARPDDDVASVVEAIVRPATELAERGWRGRSFLLIMAELIEEDPASQSRELRDVLDRTGGPAVYEVLEARLPALPEALFIERISLITSFILRAVADRARATGQRGGRGRPQLAREAFVRNLVHMVSAALAAPAVRA